MLRENIGYKLLALGIAIVVWYYANNVQSPKEPQTFSSTIITRQFSVPLRVQGLESGCRVAGMGIPRKVALTIEGNRDDALALMAEKDDVYAYVDLHGMHSGNHMVPVKLMIPRRFEGLASKTVEPNVIRVNMQEDAQKQLNVEATSTTPGTDDLNVDDIVIRPNKATVSGPADIVNSISRLVVSLDATKFDSSDVSDSFTIKALDKDGHEVEGAEIQPNRAQIRIVRAQSTDSQTAYVSVEAVGQPDSPLHVVDIDVEPQTVTVTGSPAALGKLKTLHTETVHIGGHTQSFTQRVSLIVPSGVHVAEGNTVAVTVKISTSP